MPHGAVGHRLTTDTIVLSSIAICMDKDEEKENFHISTMVKCVAVLYRVK